MDVEKLIPQTSLIKIRVEIISILYSVFDIEELSEDTLQLVDFICEMVELGILDEQNCFDYLNDILKDLTIGVYIHKDNIDESMAIRKVVIRNGHREVIYDCPEGFKKLERGGKICVKINMSERLRMSRQHKIAWRDHVKHKLAGIKTKRSKSLRKRTWDV